MTIRTHPSSNGSGESRTGWKVFVDTCQVFVVNVLSLSVEWITLHAIAVVTFSAYVLVIRVLKSKMTTVRVL